MKTQKSTQKIVKCSILGAVLLLLAAVAVYFGILFYSHALILQDGRSYKETTETKGEYTLTTRIVEEEPAVMVGFEIHDSAGNLLFACKGSYRAMDLKGIAFAADSYDVLVDSGDVGLMRYSFANGSWQEP